MTTILIDRLVIVNEVKSISFFNYIRFAVHCLNNYLNIIKQLLKDIYVYDNVSISSAFIVDR